ncbi:uncharacterized protein LOC130570201 isoform X3 [Triplophysa rosa]|uniref:uncharacterized protein LOC130570201 isoform X3 n=1 Tax=Triplophysa rosa TaxID=992332 RepID=UPI0025462318|nr:uncharacterized protein LOC130570201 isoform X3 [Triplophysa rosa]
MACFGAGLRDDIELQHLTEEEYSSPPDEDEFEEVSAFPRKASPSRDDTDAFRFMVLGGDDPLMNEACETILDVRHTEYANVIRIRENMKTNVARRNVSVLKTPSYWLHALKSNLIFRNGVKSIKKDMKLCESLLFPGPHVFLLVLGDVRISVKEDLLLQAVSNVFGKQALDYSMVLFIGECREKDIRRNRCVKKCRNRYHVLENTEKLLDYIETVVKERENGYFTTNFELTERAKDHFQTELGKQNLQYAERENSLRSELAGMRKTVEDLRKENTQLKERLVDSKGRVNQVRFDDSIAREIRFRKESGEYDSRENLFKQELDASEAKPYLFRKESDDSEARQILFRKESGDSEAREIEFRKQLDESKARENQFRKDLDESKATEIHLRQELDEWKCRESELNVAFKILRSEIEQLKATEKDLQRNLRETKAKEAFLLKRIQSECDIIQKNEELQMKETELCERWRELEVRERDLAQRSTRSGGSQSLQYIRTAVDKIRLHEGDGAESSDGESHVTGSDVTEGLWDSVRRNSLQVEPPNSTNSPYKHWQTQMPVTSEALNRCSIGPGEELFSMKYSGHQSIWTLRTHF